MRKRRLLLAPMLLSLLPGPAMANQNEFCAGFLEGFKSVMGTMAIMPICPLEPIGSIGSTSFGEGFKAAIALISAHFPNRIPSARAGDPRDSNAMPGDPRTTAGQAGPGSGFGTHTQAGALGRPPYP